MKTCTVGVRAEFGEGRLPAPVFTLASRPALWHWINDHELEELRETLAHGNLPADFLWKLKHLAGGDLNHRFIERNCRQFAALLLGLQTQPRSIPIPMLNLQSSILVQASSHMPGTW